jgi:general nucleoside transport system permease protein
MDEGTINILSSIVANATPLVIASIGETITERAGVVNLSLDGSIVLAAMAGFVGAFLSGSVIVGLIVAMIVGALVALIIALADIELRQDQVAIGFVLTILAADLAQFLGDEYVRKPGPTVEYWPLPLLSQIPIAGKIFFDHNVLVYFSYILAVSHQAWFSPSRRWGTPRSGLRAWCQCQPSALPVYDFGWGIGGLGWCLLLA